MTIFDFVNMYAGDEYLDEEIMISLDGRLMIIYKKVERTGENG